MGWREASLGPPGGRVGAGAERPAPLGEEVRSCPGVAERLGLRAPSRPGLSGAAFACASCAAGGAAPDPDTHPGAHPRPCPRAPPQPVGGPPLPTGVLRGLVLLWGRPGSPGPMEGEGADFFLFLVGRGLRDPGLREVSVLPGPHFPERRPGRGCFDPDPDGGTLSPVGGLRPGGGQGGGTAGPPHPPSGSPCRPPSGSSGSPLPRPKKRFGPRGQKGQPAPPCSKQRGAPQRMQGATLSRWPSPEHWAGWGLPTAGGGMQQQCRAPPLAPRAPRGLEIPPPGAPLPPAPAPAPITLSGWGRWLLREGRGTHWTPPFGVPGSLGRAPALAPDGSGLAGPEPR